MDNITAVLTVFTLITSINAPAYLPALQMHNLSLVPNYGAYNHNFLLNQNNGIPSQFSLNENTIPTAKVEWENSDLQSSPNIVEEFLDQVTRNRQMTVSISVPLPTIHNKMSWHEFKLALNKNYTNSYDDAIHKAAFEETKRTIHEYNNRKPPRSSKLGLTWMSDLTDEQYEIYCSGAKSVDLLFNYFPIEENNHRVKRKPTGVGAGASQAQIQIAQMMKNNLPLAQQKAAKANKTVQNGTTHGSKPSPSNATQTKPNTTKQNTSPAQPSPAQPNSPSSANNGTGASKKKPPPPAKSSTLVGKKAQPNSVSNPTSTPTQGSPASIVKPQPSSPPGTTSIPSNQKSAPSQAKTAGQTNPSSTPPTTNSTNSGTANQTPAQPTAKQIPDELNWAEKGYVGDVKFQLQCGSCWAQVACYMAEALHMKATGVFLTFSPQYFVDCDIHEFDKFTNGGCDGGSAIQAFYYIRDNGIALESSYKYKGVQEKCYKDKLTDIVKLQDILKLPQWLPFTYVVPRKDESALKIAVATYGPIIVRLFTKIPSFKNYRGPHVYADVECRDLEEDENGHAMFLVGYGIDPVDGDYWLLINSTMPQSNDIVKRVELVVVHKLKEKM